MHVVGDAQRGATLEAVITRMKMVQTLSTGSHTLPVRFVAVSATLPNTEDVRGQFFLLQISPAYVCMRICLCVCVLQDSLLFVDILYFVVE